MGKNKSNKKTTSNVETIDESIVEDKEKSTASATVNQRQVSLTEYNKNAPYSFNSKHYKILLIGLGINILGFILMIGGATEDPNKFNADELFSHTRITIAPMLIVTGYIVIMYAIMKRPKKEEK